MFIQNAANKRMHFMIVWQSKVVLIVFKMWVL